MQQVIKVKDRRQEHECDIRVRKSKHQWAVELTYAFLQGLQETYGDNGAEDNSFIDDRSDGEIERDAEGGDDDELGWLMGQRKEVDETDTVIFSQDGRRLRNTRARRKRDVTTRSQEQPGSQEGRDQKRPRTAYQRTIAEVLQRRRTRLQARRLPGEAQGSPQDEVILLDCESEESEKQKSDASQSRPPSSQPLSGSGSSEQYTPTQILVRPNGAMPAWQTEVDGNRTSYFPPAQEIGCIRSALSPICLSPASSEESPPDCSLSSCFPLPRLLGRESSSQTTVSTQSQEQKKVSASQSSKRSSRRKASQTRSREMNKENRPNVQSLFFSLVSTQPPTCSQESSHGYAHRLEHSSPPTATPSTLPQSDPAFAVPQAPSVRSSASRVNTSSASSSSHSNLTASSASTSTSASSQTSTLAVPSLLSQHHFQALSAVRAELMPFFKKNVVSLDEFKDIAKKVRHF